MRTQGLTEGAILAALVAVFAVATRYLPLIRIGTALLCPLPLAVLVIRHGLRVAVIAGLAAGLVGAALAGPLVGAAILISFAPMGIVLGVGVRRGWPAVRVVLAGALVAFVTTVVNYLGLLGGGRVSIAEMSATMERSVEMSAKLYGWLGLSGAQVEAAAAQMREFARLLPYLLPAILIMGALTAAWINYEVGRRVLARFGYQLAALPPVRAWRVPAMVVWLLPLGYLLLGLAARPGAPAALQSAGWSLVLALQMVFTFQGLLAGWVILGNYGFGRFAQVGAVALVFVVPVMGVVAFLLGLLDSVLLVRDRWGVARAPVRP